MTRDAGKIRCHRAGSYTPWPSACRLRLVTSESLDRAADPWVARRASMGKVGTDLSPGNGSWRIGRGEQSVGGALGNR